MTPTPHDPRPHIWVRLRELTETMAAEGFWDRPHAEIAPVVGEHADVLRRLGGIEALEWLDLPGRCDVCGFDGHSASYRCRACAQRYIPVGTITEELLDRGEAAVGAAHDGDGTATYRGIAASVLLSAGFAAPAAHVRPTSGGAS